MGLFDSIGSFFESALTPQGTNARRDQEASQKNAVQPAIDMIDLMKPSMMEGAAWTIGKQKSLRAGADQIFSLLSPNGMIDNAKAARDRAVSEGTMQATNYTMSHPTLDPTVKEGMMLAAQNSGTAAVNDMIVKSTLDPTFKARLLEAGKKAMEIGGPALDDYNRLIQIIMSRPGVQVQPGIAPVIGQLGAAGLAALPGGS